MKFTVANSKRSISKKFSLDENGELNKEDGGNLTLAAFDTQNCPDITTLYNYMVSDKCTDKTILIPGVTQYDSGLILTKSDIKSREDEDIQQNLVSRSKDHFYYNGSSGFILLDYDPSSDYAQNEGKPLSKDELLAILFDVLPELKKAPMIWKNSSSSNIYNSKTKEIYRGVNGQHLFVEIKNTSDIDRIISVFYKRLWLSGHGYIFMDKTGRLHDRSIIDKVVNSPEREIFLKAECKKPVSQSMEYEVFNPDKKPLVTESISDLSIVENQRFEKLVLLAKSKVQGKSDKVRAVYVKNMHDKLGLNPTKLNECIESHILYSDFPIILSNGVEITVHDIFTEPDKYDGEYCFDPFEPEYGGLSGGSTKAWIDIGNRRIHGHAHGGIWYDLEFSDRKSPKELAVTVCDNNDHNSMFKKAALGAIEMRYISTEVDQLITMIAKFANLKVGSCRRSFKGFYNRLGGDYGGGSGNDGYGGGEGVGGVDVNLDSPALDGDGVIHGEMISSNISLPINLKFPHTRERGEMRINLDTFENFEFMMKVYNIKFSYDVIFKTPTIIFPREEISDGDDHVNASMSRLRSLCVLNGLGKDSSNYAIELVNGNQLNPVLDWVRRCKWDGLSRLDVIYDSIDIATYGDSEDVKVNREFSESYKKDILRLWFIQCIAALDGGENSPLRASIAVPKYEHILVFVGGQGVQKTKFIKSLLPTLYNGYILTGHELDVKDKDNIKISISHWITELGELDSTFRKSDISSLKAFMSKEGDQIRMPYAHAESNFKRRTSFCGTVNDVQFLVDKTGNRRYLPMEVNGLLPLNQVWFDRDKLREVNVKDIEIEIVDGVLVGGISGGYGDGNSRGEVDRDVNGNSIDKNGNKNWSWGSEDGDGDKNGDGGSINSGNRDGDKNGGNVEGDSRSGTDIVGSGFCSGIDNDDSGNDCEIKSDSKSGVEFTGSFGDSGDSGKGSESSERKRESGDRENGRNEGDSEGFESKEGEKAGRESEGYIEKGEKAGNGRVLVDGWMDEKVVRIDEMKADFSDPNYRAKKSSRLLNDRLGVKNKGVGYLNLGSDEECQQLWAEIYFYYIKGEQWWPNERLEEKLGYVMGLHDRVDLIVDPLNDKFDFQKNDDWREVYINRGSEWVDANGECGVIGQAYKFHVLSQKEIAFECGLDYSNSIVMSKLSNYLATKGFKGKIYKVKGVSKRGVKICLLRGQILLRDLGK